MGQRVAMGRKTTASRAEPSTASSVGSTAEQQSTQGTTHRFTSKAEPHCAPAYLVERGRELRAQLECCKNYLEKTQKERKAVVAQLEQSEKTLEQSDKERKAVVAQLEKK